MHTSYFASRQIADKRTVAICLSVPSWYMGLCYPDLAPSPYMLGKYNSGLMSEERFAAEYIRIVLGRLDVTKVYADLVHLCGEEAVLLCYEKAGAFCHRRIVSHWLESNLGIKVPELGSEYPMLFKL